MNDYAAKHLSVRLTAVESSRRLTGSEGADGIQGTGMDIPVPRRGDGDRSSLALRPVHVAWLLGAVLLSVVLTPAAAGLTTDSPEVKAAVERGVKFLASDEAKDDRIGAWALVGLGIHKFEGKPDHPKIQAAVSKIKTALSSRDLEQIGKSLDIYSTGLAIIFLIDLDPVENRDDIEFLLAYLRYRQKPHGGWGYPNQDTGDTSMTQYGVLSSWEAIRAGFQVPTESIDKVMNWLLHTQDPSGGFGYQGVVSKNDTPVQQSQVGPALTAAGLGSVYICSTLLDINDKSERRDEQLPPALKEIKSHRKSLRETRSRPRWDARRVREVETRGEAWLRQNYKIDPPGFTHYFLYALERCVSFREFREHRSEEEPEWYDDGARYLIKTQNANGSWASQAGAVPDTAFSVLFLMRSMKRSLEKAYAFGDGTMVGGRGVPKDVDQAELRRGQLVQRSLAGSTQRLLDALEDAENRDFDQEAGLLAELPADEIEMLSASQRATVRRLVNHPSPAARLAAVQALGKTRNLDNVGVFLYALSDPDSAVVLAANEALLRISRSPRLVVVPDDPSDADRRAAIEKWKTWYRAIRPKADESGF